MHQPSRTRLLLVTLDPNRAAVPMDIRAMREAPEEPTSASSEPPAHLIEHPVPAYLHAPVLFTEVVELARRALDHLDYCTYCFPWFDRDGYPYHPDVDRPGHGGRICRAPAMHLILSGPLARSFVPERLREAYRAEGYESYEEPRPSDAVLDAAFDLLRNGLWAQNWK